MGYKKTHDRIKIDNKRGRAERNNKILLNFLTKYFA